MLTLSPESIEEVFKNHIFHFSFFKEKTDIYSKGENFPAKNISEAYKDFKTKYPDIEPFNVLDKTILNK